MGLCALAIAIAIVPAGCGTLGGAGSARLRSHSSGSVLPLNLPTRVYASDDANSANFYLTDLPPEAWKAGTIAPEHSGTIVHVHMFLVPRAGRTPIATTAVTATVRCMIITNGEVGVYGGGGFFDKNGDAGDKNFGGNVNQASLYLLHASPGFNDLLGPSEYSGSFLARKDEESAAAIARTMRIVMGQAQRVE